jgi:hypothetical protein
LVPVIEFRHNNHKMLLNEKSNIFGRIFGGHGLA